MNNNYYLYGASGHCKVLIDIIKSNGGNVVKVFDDNHSLDRILDIKVSNFNLEEIKGNLIISIGNNKIRKRISKAINKDLFGKLIHPSAIIDKTSTIDFGTVVMAGTIINSSTKIGKHCIINTASSIDHDCIIEDYVHISPNSTLCGNSVIGEGTHVGAGSVIIQGITIGKNVIIGAGSVIITDVPDNVTVVGNPGKIIKREQNGI